MYEINDVKFTLRTDLTLNQIDKISNLFGKIYAKADNVLVGSYTSQDIVKMLAILLETDSELPNSFDFGDAKESVILEVIKDFFVSRIGSTQNMLDSLKK